MYKNTELLKFVNLERFLGCSQENCGYYGGRNGNNMV